MRTKDNNVIDIAPSAGLDLVKAEIAAWTKRLGELDDSAGARAMFERWHVELAAARREIDMLREQAQHACGAPPAHSMHRHIARLGGPPDASFLFEHVVERDHRLHFCMLDTNGQRWKLLDRAEIELMHGRPDMGGKPLLGSFRPRLVRGRMRPFLSVSLLGEVRYGRGQPHLPWSSMVIPDGAIIRFVGWPEERVPCEEEW